MEPNSTLSSAMPETSGEVELGSFADPSFICSEAVTYDTKEASNKKSVGEKSSEESKTIPVYNFFTPEAKSVLPGDFYRKMLAILLANSKKYGVQLEYTREVFTHKLEESVKLNLHPADFVPVTILDLFRTACQTWGLRTAISSRDDDGWNCLSYRQYYSEVLKMAKSFLAVGLNPGEGIGIACSNSKIYFIASLAAVFAGGFFVGLPCTASQKKFLNGIIKECKVNILVMDKDIFVETIEQITLGPSVKALFYFGKHLKTVKPPKTSKPTYSENDLEFLAHLVTNEAFCLQLNTIVPNKCCAVFYPTTYDSAVATGVMFSHDNLTYMAKSFGTIIIEEYCAVGNDLHDFRIVSHLPLNKPFSLVLEMLVPLVLGGLTAFPRVSNSGPSVLMPTIEEVKPTLFCATPNIWVDLQKWLANKTTEMGKIKYELLLWSRRKCLNSYYLRQKKGLTKRTNSKNFLLTQAKKSLGFHHCDMFICFDGYLDLMTLEYFLSFDIPILQTLTTPCMSGPHCIGSRKNYLIKSVGSELQFVKSRLECKPGGVGTVHCAGRHISMGIISQANLRCLFKFYPYIKTDIRGMRGRHGNELYVKEDQQDIMVTSLGKKVSYLAIENKFKDKTPIISHCIVVGHNKPFLSILVTFKTEIDPRDFSQTNVLKKTLQVWLKQNGEDFTLISDLIEMKSTAVNRTLDDSMQMVNKNIIKKLSKIRCWRILPRDFSILEGELDPFSLKLYRKEIIRKYKDVLDDIYGPESSDSINAENEKDVHKAISNNWSKSQIL